MQVGGGLGAAPNQVTGHADVRAPMLRTAKVRRRELNRWLVHCSDPLGSRSDPPSSLLSPDEMCQLVEEADAHGVLPALIASMRAFEEVPGYEPARTDALARRRVGFGFSTMLRHHGEAILVAAADLPTAIVKGCTFARRLYPDPTLRPFSDVDLLVAPSAVPAVNDILRAQGFEFAAYAHDPERQEAKWVHRNNPVVLVEVHTNLVHHPDLRASLSLTYDDIRHGPETPAVLLAIATLHGALHRFERLRQIVDICQAARHMATRDDEAAFEKVLQRMGGRFAAIAGLELAHRLFDERRCHDIAKALGPVRYSRVARWLVGRSAVASTMSGARFYHSWRRQAFRSMLKRSRRF